MNAEPGPSIIRAGTFYGECLVQCNETVIITPETTQYALTGNLEHSSQGDVVGEMKTPDTLWQELRGLVDWGYFKSLPSEFGQPDASDQGGEYVEITVDGDTHRVTFEINASVKDIALLVRRLREVRVEAGRRFRR